MNPGTVRPDKIRFAVIGMGWVGTERHIPNLLRHPQVELVGVIDRRPERAEEKARQHGIKYWAASEDGNVSWIDQVDAVTVATAPHSHYAVARAMLELGKHVLLEKPMAMTMEEGHELVTLSQNVKRILAMVHNFQFARSFKTLQRKHQQGAIGDIQSILVVQLSNPGRRLPRWYDELPLGLFYDESPHLFCLVRRLAAEEPRFISAQIVPSTIGKRTPASVTAHFCSGAVPIQVYMNFEAPVSEWHFLVLGSKRLAIVDIFRDILLLIRNDGSHRARDILRTSRDAVRLHAWECVKSGFLYLLGNLRYGNDEIISLFVRAIGSDRPPEFISAEEGYRVLDMQHRVIRHGRYL